MNKNFPSDTVFPSTAPFVWLEEELAELDAMGLRRKRFVVERRQPGLLTLHGHTYVDFASNDYLGLASDERVGEAAARVIAETGWGAGAAPLVTGYSRYHEDLEKALAKLAGTEAALLFGSGYVANTAILSAIAGSEDIVFCEKRAHASLVDGCRLSGATFRVFRVEERDKLKQRLQATRGFRRRWIVTDSVFSMDGDVAPLADLCEIAEVSEAALYVDEAHAFGVLGATGGGVAELQGVSDRIPLRLGTLGKAFGSVGAFVCCSSLWAEWLLHRARGYVYSTGLPAAAAAASLMAVRIAGAEPQRRQQAQALAENLRSRLAHLGWDSSRSRTPIVPLDIGDARQSQHYAEYLRARGLWTVAIRPPTVPKGSARLRLSLSAAHRPEHLDTLLATLAEARLHLTAP